MPKGSVGSVKCCVCGKGSGTLKSLFTNSDIYDEGRLRECFQLETERTGFLCPGCKRNSLLIVNSSEVKRYGYTVDKKGQLCIHKLSNDKKHLCSDLSSRCCVRELSTKDNGIKSLKQKLATITNVHTEILQEEGKLFTSILKQSDNIAAKNVRGEPITLSVNRKAEVGSNSACTSTIRYHSQKSEAFQSMSSVPARSSSSTEAIKHDLVSQQSSLIKCQKGIFLSASHTKSLQAAI